jgi:hypothetical protein
MNKLALCAGKLGARSKWHHDTTHLLKNERRSQYGYNFGFRIAAGRHPRLEVEWKSNASR